MKDEFAYSYKVFSLMLVVKKITCVLLKKNDPESRLPLWHNCTKTDTFYFFQSFPMCTKTGADPFRTRYESVKT